MSNNNPQLIKYPQNRLVVTRDISTIIHEISVQDAVHIVLPIIIQLAKDTEDSVKEALAGELDKIMYYYFEVNKMLQQKKKKEKKVMV